jgi:hypothetical protein
VAIAAKRFAAWIGSRVQVRGQRQVYGLANLRISVTYMNTIAYGSSAARVSEQQGFRLMQVSIDLPSAQ